MSKLYYTNPIIAAYMADEFGVRYEPLTIHKTMLIKGKLTPYTEKRNIKLKRLFKDFELNINRKYYIHPDSLSVFEPKIWDVVEWDGIMYGDVIGKNENIIGIQHGKSDVYMVDINEITILQRNNKPFFVPENEE